MSFGSLTYGGLPYEGGGSSGSVIQPSGFVDEQFGSFDIGGGAIQPSNFVDEAFGVFQVVNGPLWQFYGPLTTPLIADAPYSQVYS
jgi:hypothetical protein